MYAVLIQSVVTAVAGTRLRWQQIPRAGRFSAAPRNVLTAAPDESTATVPIPVREAS